MCLLWCFNSSLFQFSSVRVTYNSWWPHGLQHARPGCPSPTPGIYSNSCLLCQWCHPTISSSVVPFSSHLPSFPASGSFPVSQFFRSGGQSIRVSASASILPMTIQDWSPLGWTGWISLQSKGLSRVRSNTTVQKHQFFGAQLSLWSNSCIQTWLLIVYKYWEGFTLNKPVQQKGERKRYVTNAVRTYRKGKAYVLIITMVWSLTYSQMSWNVKSSGP